MILWNLYSAQILIIIIRVKLSVIYPNISIIREEILKFFSPVVTGWLRLWAGPPGGFREVKTVGGPGNVVREESLVYRSQGSRIQEEEVRLLSVSVHSDGQQDTVILSLASCDQPVSWDQLSNDLTWSW